MHQTRRAAWDGFRPRETDLYPPVKGYLEAMGFEVKGEVASADVVAMRPGEDPVVVELKTGFSLALFHQGLERQAVTDRVYLAVPRLPGRRFQAALKSNLGLCRRLGLGLMTGSARTVSARSISTPAPTGRERAPPERAGSCANSPAAWATPTRAEPGGR